MLHRALHSQAILVVSFVAGITLSLVTHRRLTYRSHGVRWAEYLRLYVVYGEQLVLNMVSFGLRSICWRGMPIFRSLASRCC